jgi:hypothetical protein
MTEWTEVPEPVTWSLVKPVTFNGMSYGQVTLRAPTAEETMTATAVRGASNMEIVLRLISAVSGERVPYEVLRAQPQWLLTQMADYFEEFTGAPAPGPLEEWRKAREAARLAAITAAATPDGDKAIPPQP